MMTEPQPPFITLVLRLARLLGRKLWQLCIQPIGGISLVGVAIIVIAVTVNIKLLESSFLLAARGETSRDSYGPLPLNDNYVISFVSLSAGVSPETTRYLVDGSIGTLAAPGNSIVDYMIDLGGLIDVRELTVYWGAYGVDSNYITEYHLEGKTDTRNETPWQELAAGGFPNTRQLVVRVNQPLSQIRVRASSKNYFGIYEVMVDGKVLRR